MHRAPIILAILCAALPVVGGDAIAEPLSPRPITIIVPFTPGASADTLQRLVAKKVTDNTGQVFVMESKAGGGGTVATMAVKQATPDGLTLLQANQGTHAVNVSLSSLPYDPIKDFQPITLQWSFPQLLVVPADSPAKSVAELIALAKSKPGGLSYASQGTGSGGHMLGAILANRLGVHMVHVPYRGAAPAALDLVAGRVDFFFVSYASMQSFIQAGKARTLAVTSGKRLAALSDVPTMEEAGLTGFVNSAWFGLVGPAAMPKPMVDKLHDAFALALKDPQIVKAMTDQGAEAVPNTPAEYSALIKDEIDKYAKIIKEIGAKAQ